eukprot:2945535-Rhodomonas_salina.1
MVRERACCIGARESHAATRGDESTDSDAHAPTWTGESIDTDMQESQQTWTEATMMESASDPPNMEAGPLWSGGAGARCSRKAATC